MFYPLFGLGANVALIFSGRAVKYFSQARPGCRRRAPASQGRAPAGLRRFPVGRRADQGGAARPGKRAALQPAERAPAPRLRRAQRRRRGGAQIRSRLPAGVDGWGYSLRGMMGMVVVGGLLITLTYFFMQRKVVPRVMALQKVRRPPWLPCPHVTTHVTAGAHAPAPPPARGCGAHAGVAGRKKQGGRARPVAWVSVQRMRAVAGRLQLRGEAGGQARGARARRRWARSRRRRRSRSWAPARACPSWPSRPTSATWPPWCARTRRPRPARARTVQQASWVPKGGPW